MFGVVVTPLRFNAFGFQSLLTPLALLVLTLPPLSHLWKRSRFLLTGWPETEPGEDSGLPGSLASASPGAGFLMRTLLGVWEEEPPPPSPPPLPQPLTGPGAHFIQKHILISVSQYLAPFEHSLIPCVNCKTGLLSRQRKTNTV